VHYVFATQVLDDEGVAYTISNMYSNFTPAFVIQSRRIALLMSSLVLNLIKSHGTTSNGLPYCTTFTKWHTKSAKSNTHEVDNILDSFLNVLSLSPLLQCLPLLLRVLSLREG
jgi:hypothetical protein